LASLHFYKCTFSYDKQDEVHEIGGACRKHWSEVSFIIKRGRSKLRNTDRLKKKVNERIILKWIISRQREGEEGSLFIQDMACEKLV
jgi:hypothetical protein